MPTGLVSRFPDGIVLDDAYIDAKALEAGYTIRYVPHAIKYHHTRNSIKFYLNQRRKNWAGQFQVRKRRGAVAQPPAQKVRTFLHYLSETGITSWPPVTAVGLCELIGFLWGAYDHVSGRYPVKWYRDGSNFLWRAK